MDPSGLPQFPYQRSPQAYDAKRKKTKKSVSWNGSLAIFGECSACTRMGHTQHVLSRPGTGIYAHTMNRAHTPSKALGSTPYSTDLIALYEAASPPAPPYYLAITAGLLVVARLQVLVRNGRKDTC